MNIELLLSYTILSLFLGLIPGPSVLFTMTYSMQNSKMSTLSSIFGQLSGSLIYISLVFVGINNLPNSLFFFLKIFGGIYVTYLGIKLLRVKNSNYFINQDLSKENPGKGFAKGFLICISNPKIFLHFSAFLPQFTTPTGNLSYELTILSILTLFTGFIALIIYASAPSLMRIFLNSEKFNYYLFKTAGICMSIAGLFLILK